ncbi:SDR family oxidoreductase [Microbacterium stercoris]|uniref:SDR family oxidoreductase n=1 Tax=Microbacterium stercoris TaxID=2820289 RepID=A0A939QP36_9MICO|nr:SDR family oxidoreductase [Microbacterium stercoris]MBO3664195.1 SDR family oxidoreductase [Microbacterium stercoris]
MSRTYVVTGSASGVGQATARLLRDRGHRVIGVDLHDAEVTADLSAPQGRLRAAAEAVELAGGQLDAVIACAGISAPIAKTMAINYFGVVELLTAIRPALAASAAPRAAVVSSMASLQQNSSALVDAALSGDEEATLAIGDALAQEGAQQGYLNYPSSKRALSRWVRRAAISPEWAGAGIPVNAVAPGTVLTPMTKDLLSTPEGVAMVDGAVPMPLNGHQSPESVAELLIWLASAENTHTTGQTIYIDGGAEATLRGDDVWRWNDSTLS